MAPQSAGKLDTHWDSKLDPHSIVLLKELGGWVAEGKLKLLRGGQIGKGGQVEEARETLKFVKELGPDAVCVGAVEDHVGFGAEVLVREA